MKRGQAKRRTQQPPTFPPPPLPLRMVGGTRKDTGKDNNPALSSMSGREGARLVSGLPLVARRGMGSVVVGPAATATAMATATTRTPHARERGLGREGVGKTSNNNNHNPRRTCAVATTTPPLLV